MQISGKKKKQNQQLNSHKRLRHKLSSVHSCALKKYVIFHFANNYACKKTLQGSWMTQMHNIKRRYCSTEVLLIESLLQAFQSHLCVTMDSPCAGVTPPQLSLKKHLLQRDNDLFSGIGYWSTFVRTAVRKCSVQTDVLDDLRRINMRK